MKFNLSMFYHLGAITSYPELWISGSTNFTCSVPKNKVSALAFYERNFETVAIRWKNSLASEASSNTNM